MENVYKFMKVFEQDKYEMELLKESEKRAKQMLNDMAGYLCSIENLNKKVYCLEKILESYENQFKENKIIPKTPDVDFGCEFLEYVQRKNVREYCFGTQDSIKHYDEFKRALQEKYMGI